MSNEREALSNAVNALERLADWTEMSGSGELESMTGPAMAELRARLRYADLAANAGRTALVTLDA